MTEREWLASEDPAKMLRLLAGESGAGSRLSVRKARHLVVAFLAAGDYEAWAPSGYELWADDDYVIRPEHNQPFEMAFSFCRPGVAANPRPPAAAAIVREVCGNPFRPYCVETPDDSGAAFHRYGVVAGVGDEFPEAVRVASYRTVTPCVPRELFRPEQARYFDPAWLTPEVTALAQTVYDDSDWGLMPLLGDALEEAGCVDRDMLWHCRNGQRCLVCGGGSCTACRGTGQIPLRATHARGCWLIDMLLGKS